MPAEAHEDSHSAVASNIFMTFCGYVPGRNLRDKPGPIFPWATPGIGAATYFMFHLYVS